MRAIILTGTCDLPAKASFLYLKQWNGYFGCNTCKIEGLRMNKTQLYPYDSNIILRTTSETVEIARGLTDKSKEGVKAEFPFLKISHNYIDNMSIDVLLHCVFINVIKRLFSIWFDSCNSNHPGSLRKFKGDVNDRLTSFKTLDFISRTPRTVDDYSYWKANEMKWFILAYSLPIFHDLMDEKYFSHYKLFVKAITILNSHSISYEDLEEAEICLDKFVKDFEYLYGLENMTINVHMLLHLCRNVRLFGPLWTTSCSPFEHLNGVLKSFVKSSKHPELQIFSSLEMFVHYLYFKDEYLTEGSATYNFCNVALKRERFKKLTKRIRDQLYIVDKIQNEKKDTLPRKVAEATKHLIKDNHKIFTFNRLKLKGLLYETESYSRSYKRNSSCLSYNFKGKNEIGIIQAFVMLCECNDGEHQECCKVYPVIQRCVSEKAFTCRQRRLFVDSTYLIEKINNIALLAIDIEDIGTVSFSLSVDDLVFAVKPPYTMEFE